MRQEKFFARLAESIGRPELATDERFATFSGRFENREDLVAILDDAFGGDTTDAWISKLGAAGVPCGPVNDVEQAFAEPHTQARGLVVETEHPRYGTVRQPASPVRVGSPPQQHRRAPQRNEDFEYVTTKLLGYDPARVDALAAAGAFG